MKLPRRQNPHMHLLEAVLALHAATGEKNWLRRATALVDLFKQRFLDPQTGALIEYFGEDWSVAPGDEGRLREPGHQFEWVWLLFEYSRMASDPSIVPYAGRLFAFGSRYGIEHDEGLKGAVFDGVDAQRALVAGTKLLWPQTEYIKACVARAEWLNDSAARAAIPAHLALIAQHFMRPGRRELAQSARARRHADDAGHARARAVSPVPGGGGGGAGVGKAANSDLILRSDSKRNASS